MLVTIIAALLASAAPEETSPLHEEAFERTRMCIALVNKKATSAQAVSKFKLFTPDKVKDFQVGCLQFILGVDVGYGAAVRDAAQNENSN